MRIIKSTLKGDECVFTGSYSECSGFCKDGGFVFLDTFTFKGDVIHEKWYDVANNTVYLIEETGQ